MGNTESETNRDFALYQDTIDDLSPDTGQDSSLPQRASIGNIVLFCAASSTVLTLIWKLMPDSILPFAKTSLIGFSSITLIRLFLSLLVPVVFFSYRYRILDSELMGHNPGMGAFLLSFLIGCPTSLILVSVHNLIIRFLVLNGISLTLPAFFYVSEDISTEAKLLALTVAFLIPVLLQELFFRGLLFSSSLKSTSIFIKIFLSALLFAVYMQNPVDFVPLFLLGILLAYVRQATGNFLCPVITQISMLLTYFAFSPLLPYLDYRTPGLTGEIDSASLYKAIAALVISLLAFLPVLAQLRRMYHEEAAILSKTQEENTGYDNRGQFGWSLWIGILLFATSWVVILGI